MNVFFKFVVAIMLATTGFSQTLKVGTNPTYPPFEFIDEQNKITGFDLDLMEAVSKKVGFSYTVINMSFDGLIPALKTGKIDIAASAMSATPQRKKAVDFSDSYYNTENLFLKVKGNENLKSKLDFGGKKIGVQLGTVQEIAARGINEAKTVAFDEIGTAIRALKVGKVDMVLVDSSIGYGYLKKNSDLMAFYKEPDGSDGFSFALDKDKNTELISKINAAIKELKMDGTYDKILLKYDLK